MSFETSLTWTRTTPDFVPDTWDRSHRWTTGSGHTVQASSAPSFKGDAALVNPEEALIGALSSCHMLTFLAIAAKKGFVVDSYEDAASGELSKNEQGRLSVNEITLRPRARFSGAKVPDEAAVRALHDLAHQNCFIANSIRARVTIEAG